MPADFDVAIVGSGFAGSLLAMIARRLGRSVILLERGRHPRFAIGESSTPLANQVWEELTRRYGLERLTPLAKWGSWQREHPELAAGLKRGFTFYHHTAGQPFGPDPDHARQWLVAASARDDVADTHWFRAEVDAFLVREAQALGVEYLDEVALREVTFAGDVVGLAGEQRGRPIQVRARWLADATGPRGFLFRALGLPEQPLEFMPPTESLFTHFTGVERWDRVQVSGETPIYPPDDAALHHVFEGGWMWVLRFNQGITSAGVAVSRGLAHTLGLSECSPAWTRLLERLPTVREQFAGARPVRPFVHLPELAFRVREAAGPRWALLPHAAGFIDPLMSTGIALSLQGVARLAAQLEEDWGRPRFEDRGRRYDLETRQELRRIELLVAALYGTMADFGMFCEIGRLYFAGVAYAEIGRRLGCGDRVGQLFLLGDHPTFGPGLEACCREALRLYRQPAQPAAELDRLRRRIRDLIEPIDLTGLNRDDRRNWYPVDAADLLGSASKLGLTAEEVTRRRSTSKP